jgi:hypothetical protein
MTVWLRCAPVIDVAIRALPSFEDAIGTNTAAATPMTAAATARPRIILAMYSPSVIVRPHPNNA